MLSISIGTTSFEEEAWIQRENADLVEAFGIVA